MTVNSAGSAALRVQISPRDRRTILNNVLAVLQERFYSPEKLNANWESAVERCRPMIENANTADDFEQSVSDLLAELRTSHVGFFTAARAELRVELRLAQPILRTIRPLENGGYFKMSIPEVPRR